MEPVLSNSVAEPSTSDQSLPPPEDLTKTSRKHLFLWISLVVILFSLGIVLYFSLIPKPEKIVQKKNQIPDSAPVAQITPKPTKIPVIYPTPKVALADSVAKTSLYYQDGKKLYKQSPLLSTPTVFLELVDSYAFSPDKKFIAYTKGYGPGSDNDVRILNIDKKTSVVIPGNEVNRSISWSPDGKYVVVDAGTGPGGTMTIYNAVTGNQILSFADGNILWHDGLIYMTQGTGVETPRPWDSGTGRSIVRINPSAGKSEKLILADDNNDYTMTNIAGDCLYYAKTTVTNQEDWEDNSKQTSTAYCYSLSTGTSKISSGKQMGSSRDQLLSKVLDIFPEYGRSHERYVLQVVDNVTHPDWVIMSIYNGESVYESDIMIFNLKNPRDTFHKIATGAALTWH